MRGQVTFDDSRFPGSEEQARTALTKRIERLRKRGLEVTCGEIYVTPIQPSQYPRTVGGWPRVAVTIDGQQVRWFYDGQRWMR